MWMPGSICKVTVRWHAAATTTVGKTKRGDTGWSNAFIYNDGAIEDRASRQLLFIWRSRYWCAQGGGGGGGAGRVCIPVTTLDGWEPQTLVSFADIQSCDTVSLIQGLSPRRSFIFQPFPCRHIRFEERGKNHYAQGSWKGCCVFVIKEVTFFNMPPAELWFSQQSVFTKTDPPRRNMVVKARQQH